MRRPLTKMLSIFLTVALMVSTFGVTVRAATCPKMTKECVKCTMVEASGAAAISKNMSCCKVVSERHQLSAEMEHLPITKVAPVALLAVLLTHPAIFETAVLPVRPAFSPHFSLPSAAPLYLLISSFLI